MAGSPSTLDHLAAPCQPLSVASGSLLLWNADCLDVLPQITATAVITDPPYGINDAAFDSGPREGKRKGGDNTWHPPSDWDAEIKPEWCAGVCAAAPLVAWMGHWRKRSMVEAAMPHKLRAEIVWAKDCHVGPPCPVAMQDERLWLFSRDGITAKRFDTTVWSVPIIPPWAHKHHKNEKPVALMARAIYLLTSEGDTVLDPFMGSGTTAIACIRTGRKFIGVERDPAHFQTAVERIRRELAQGDLFLPANTDSQTRV